MYGIKCGIGKDSVALFSVEQDSTVEQLHK